MESLTKSDSPVDPALFRQILADDLDAEATLVEVVEFHCPGCGSITPVMVGILTCFGCGELLPIIAVYDTDEDDKNSE